MLCSMPAHGEPMRQMNRQCGKNKWGSEAHIVGIIFAAELHKAVAHVLICDAVLRHVNVHCMGQNLM